MDYKRFEYVFLTKRKTSTTGMSSHFSGNFLFLSAEGIHSTQSDEERFLMKYAPGFVKKVDLGRSEWQQVYAPEYQFLFKFDPWRRFATLKCVGDGNYRARAEMPPETKEVKVELRKGMHRRPLGTAQEKTQLFPNDILNDHKILHIDFKLHESITDHLLFFSSEGNIEVTTDPFLRYGDCCKFHRFRDTGSDEASNASQKTPRMSTTDRPQTSIPEFSSTDRYLTEFLQPSVSEHGSQPGTPAEPHPAVSTGESPVSDERETVQDTVEEASPTNQTPRNEVSTPEPARDDPRVPGAHNTSVSHEARQTTREASNEMSEAHTVPNTDNDTRTQVVTEALRDTTTTGEGVRNATRCDIEHQVRIWLTTETEVEASALCKRYPEYTFGSLRKIWQTVKKQLKKSGYSGSLASLTGHRMALESTTFTRSMDVVGTTIIVGQ
ncbi:hypothetical protein EDB81DRAFT_820213 [Dactylonectria macrodidyma]|uniref:Uncharacterized protein n=1 Tax=Dactylonectria macrodidyma TaxID=307937 RepID=A0A9P9DAZ2_9HYPO|nr:hypothetical protein EDB81DRAFT_820213 [Dactylonectria macrodidyma]